MLILTKRNELQKRETKREIMMYAMPPTTVVVAKRMLVLACITRSLLGSKGVLGVLKTNCNKPMSWLWLIWRDVVLSSMTLILAGTQLPALTSMLSPSTRSWESMVTDLPLHRTQVHWTSFLLCLLPKPRKVALTMVVVRIITTAQPRGGVGGWIGVGNDGDNGGRGDEMATASAKQDDNPSAYFMGDLDAYSLVGKVAANLVNGKTKEGFITKKQYQSICCLDMRATTNCIQHSI